MTFLRSQEKIWQSPSPERLTFVEPLTAFSPSCFCLSNLACSDQLPQSERVFVSSWHQWVPQIHRSKKLPLTTKLQRKSKSPHDTQTTSKNMRTNPSKKKTDLQTSSKPFIKCRHSWGLEPRLQLRCHRTELLTMWHRMVQEFIDWNHPLQHEKSSSDAFQCVRKKKKKRTFRVQSYKEASWLFMNEPGEQLLHGTSWCYKKMSGSICLQLSRGLSVANFLV